MFVSDEQPSNADVPIVVNVDGSTTSFNDLQPLNVANSIVVTDSGIVICVNDEQPRNAFWPIDVTDDGIVMRTNLLQPENAKSPMRVTFGGMFNSVRNSHLLNAWSLIWTPGCSNKYWIILWLDFSHARKSGVLFKYSFWNWIKKKIWCEIGWIPNVEIWFIIVKLEFH